MFELDGCSSSVTGTSQNREGNEGSIAALNLDISRHHRDNVSNLRRLGICSSRCALAVLVSLADRLKYSASEYEIRDLYPCCSASQMTNRFRALRVAYSVVLLRRSLVRRPAQVAHPKLQGAPAVGGVFWMKRGPQLPAAQATERCRDPPRLRPPKRCGRLRQLVRIELPDAGIVGAPPAPQARHEAER